MLHKLFSSKVRIELLNHLLSAPGRNRFTSGNWKGLPERIIKNVSTELKNLESLGLLASSKSGNLNTSILTPDFSSTRN